MLTKTVTYTDYDGNERTEKCQFNLTETELTEMQLTTSGGMDKMLTDIVAAKDTPTIINTFKTIILKAYGVKSPDGRTFMKSKELADEFEHSEVYNKIFMELITDDEKAAAFINGIIPKTVADEVAKSSAAPTLSISQPYGV